MPTVIRGNNLSGFSDSDGNFALLLPIIVGAAIGYALGGAISAVRQGIALSEGSQEEFSWQEVFSSAAQGAIVGSATPIIALYPPTLVALSTAVTTFGFVEGALEFHSGQYATGLFDLGRLLSLSLKERGGRGCDEKGSVLL